MGGDRQDGLEGLVAAIPTMCVMEPSGRKCVLGKGETHHCGVKDNRWITRTVTLHVPSDSDSVFLQLLLSVCPHLSLSEYKSLSFSASLMILSASTISWFLLVLVEETSRVHA